MLENIKQCEIEIVKDYLIELMRDCMNENFDLINKMIRCLDSEIKKNPKLLENTEIRYLSDLMRNTLNKCSGAKNKLAWINSFYDIDMHMHKI
jgi:hypothetical protein